MRALWKVHGRPAPAEVGLVAKPYTLRDARERLAEVGGRALADEFFDRYVEGRQVPDYAALVEAAGVVVRRVAPGRAWSGVAFDGGGRVSAPDGLVAWGTPAFDAGLAEGDVVLAADGAPFSPAAASAWRPGQTVALSVRRVDGRAAALTMTLAEDPRLEAVPVESAGRAPTAAQRQFGEAWLGAKRR
jgi:predicted metalloprotease with PDZ domain